MIDQLQESPNFHTTHSLIAKLQRNSYWTAHQIDKLCQAVVENNQVGWLIADDDVCSFYKRLLADTTDRTGDLKTVYDMLFEAEEDQRGNEWKEHEAEIANDEELPF